jgi:hypothetical protein
VGVGSDPSGEKGFEQEGEECAGEHSRADAGEHGGEDNAQDVAALCAERHADAELAGALRDGVGDDGVEADDADLLLGGCRLTGDFKSGFVAGLGWRA